MFLTLQDPGLCVLFLFTKKTIEKICNNISASENLPNYHRYTWLPEGSARGRRGRAG